MIVSGIPHSARFLAKGGKALPGTKLSAVTNDTALTNIFIQLPSFSIQIFPTSDTILRFLETRFSLFFVSKRDFLFFSFLKKELFPWLSHNRGTEKLANKKLLIISSRSDCLSRFSSRRRLKSNLVLSSCYVFFLINRLPSSDLFHVIGNLSITESIFI